MKEIRDETKVWRTFQATTGSPSTTLSRLQSLHSQVLDQQRISSSILTAVSFSFHNLFGCEKEDEEGTFVPRG